MPPRVVLRSRAASSTSAVSSLAALRSETCFRSSAIAAVRFVTAPVVRERLRSPRLRSDSSTEALLLSRTSRALAVLCLLLEARPALVADLVVASREEVADVVVLVHAHRLAVCLQDFGDHLGEGPPVAKAFEDARDVFVHRPPPGRGDFLDPVREPEREPVIQVNIMKYAVRNLETGVGTRVGRWVDRSVSSRSDEAADEGTFEAAAGSAPRIQRVAPMPSARRERRADACASSRPPAPNH